VNSKIGNLSPQSFISPPLPPSSSSSSFSSAASAPSGSALNNYYYNISAPKLQCGPLIREVVEKIQVFQTFLVKLIKKRVCTTGLQPAALSLLSRPPPPPTPPPPTPPPPPPLSPPVFQSNHFTPYNTLFIMPLQPFLYDLFIALLVLLVTPATLTSASLIHDAHLSTGTCTSAAECVSRALTLASSGQIPAAYPLFKRAATLNASDVSQPLLPPAPRRFCV
jgi:hypothetical protein